MQGNILATVWALCGEEGGGVESTLEEADMNEKGYFQIYQRERFRPQVRMHVWQPGFARTC